MMTEKEAVVDAEPRVETEKSEGDLAQRELEGIKTDLGTQRDEAGVPNAGPGLEEDVHLSREKERLQGGLLSACCTVLSLSSVHLLLCPLKL